MSYRIRRQSQLASHMKPRKARTSRRTFDGWGRGRTGFGGSRGRGGATRAASAGEGGERTGLQVHVQAADAVADGALHVDALQQRAGEVGAGKVGAGQDGLAKVGAGKIGAL